MRKIKICLYKPIKCPTPKALFRYCLRVRVQLKPEFINQSHKNLCHVISTCLIGWPGLLPPKAVYMETSWILKAFLDCGVKETVNLWRIFRITSLESTSKFVETSNDSIHSQHAHLLMHVWERSRKLENKLKSFCGFSTTVEHGSFCCL